MNIKPIAGKAYVRPYNKYEDVEGGIFVPEIAKYVSGTAGVVTDYTPYQDGVKSMVWHKGKRKLKDAYLWNDIYDGMIGKHILFDTGRRFIHDKENYYIVRLENILAINDKPMVALRNEGVGLVERCQFCKSSDGEGNIMLSSSGYCPVCARNGRGERRSTDTKLSDTEAYGISGQAEIDRRKQVFGIADKEQIISYSGQKKRRRNRTFAK